MTPEWVYPESEYGHIERAYVDKVKGAYVVCKPDPSSSALRVVKHGYDAPTVWSACIGPGGALDV